MNRADDARFEIIHGTLVSVFGQGVLLIGESGSGKTNLAFALLMRGHRLVADDSVELFVRQDRAVGRSPNITANLIHKRELGIPLDLRHILGSDAVVQTSDIDLCFELWIPSMPREETVIKSDRRLNVIPLLANRIESSISAIETAALRIQIGSSALPEFT